MAIGGHFTRSAMPSAMHANQREPEAGAEAGEDHPDSARARGAANQFECSSGRGEPHVDSTRRIGLDGDRKSIEFGLPIRKIPARETKRSTRRRIDAKCLPSAEFGPNRGKNEERVLDSERR